MRSDGVPIFDGGNPFVFTYNDPYSNECNQVEVLKDFLNQFAEPKTPNIDVYPLTRLFYVLRMELAARGKCEGIPNENFTNVLLSRDPYETTAGISCEVSVTFAKISVWTFVEENKFFNKNLKLVSRGKRCNTALRIEPRSSFVILVGRSFLQAAGHSFGCWSTSAAECGLIAFIVVNGNWLNGKEHFKIFLFIFLFVI